MKYLLLLGMLFALGSCITPFEPEVTESQLSYLVVDGFINSQGISTIKLSQSVNLQSNATIPERKAIVYIEQETGPRYQLPETNAGTYVSDQLALNSAKSYRLYIKTGTGVEYVSDYTEVKTTPPIDSITWKATDRGLQLYVNSHDANTAARHYRWAYDETWQFTSAFESLMEYKQKDIVFRKDDIYHCWGTEKSTAIRIGNTVKLSQNIVSRYPLQLLLSNSVKLRYKYSILVKQYALTQQEYEYWEALGKNTENIGTLFDPLPSQVTGNVHCLSKPEILALGFVGVQSETVQRIFVARNELPRSWVAGNGYSYPACSVPDSVIDAQRDEAFKFGRYIPILPIYKGPTNELWGWVAGPLDCVDCRTRGTNVRPDFWK
ncbi:DUF4249 domain-containing protein [Hymenobacter wooponensis]|uniref:DUF4249 domain-containing protein n=1 Tax=Hymenobacter wooponensis TaxID=1525360 RepID=A0A4Z0MIQ9_9BACT|nr:DUF4249 domain-containing protein [Hymenobacter wooponensis]TGD79406.1 DUF4249 domain-containing protein [Hymenobacter wooponensis]